MGATRNYGAINFSSIPAFYHLLILTGPGNWDHSSYKTWDYLFYIFYPANADRLPLPWDSVHWLAQCTPECHWNAIGWPSVHWDTTGRPSEYLQGTLGQLWKNLFETVPHWNATGETILYPVAFQYTLGSKCQAHWIATGLPLDYHWLRVRIVVTQWVRSHRPVWHWLTYPRNISQKKILLSGINILIAFVPSGLTRSLACMGLVSKERQYQNQQWLISLTWICITVPGCVNENGRLIHWLLWDLNVIKKSNRQSCFTDWYLQISLW